MPWSRLPTPDGGNDAPEPAAVGEVIDRVLSHLGAPKAEAIVAIHDRWRDIVGVELVAHASPLAVEDGRLKVGVDSPAWASHLRWSEAEIVARIDRLVGPGIVTSVTTKIAR